MKKGSKIPVYDLCTLQQQEHRQQDDIIIEPFAEYLKRHPHLFIPHRHTFYHLVLFTAGSGTHTIDFEQFTLTEGQIYFMIPGQVHSWQFGEDVDGYVINFSENFISAFLRRDHYLEQFPFLEGIAMHSVINLDAEACPAAIQLIKNMLQESLKKERWYGDKMRLQLLELLIMVHRNSGQHRSDTTHPYSDITLRHFRKLVEQHYTSLHLPKDYAALLYITPNHLNALCKDLLGKPAGELIRDRVLLEAKRLLVNAELTISEIAWQLSFADNSYFTKFFKKQTGITPEAFRKSVTAPVSNS